MRGYWEFFSLLKLLEIDELLKSFTRDSTRGQRVGQDRRARGTRDEPFNRLWVNDTLHCVHTIYLDHTPSPAQLLMANRELRTR